MPGPITPLPVQEGGPMAAFLVNLKDQLGKSYVLGDTGPSAFDCSGLVQYAAQTAGIKGVPRTSEAQWAWVQKVQQKDLQPGDLVFSQWPGDNASPGHVQVYIGNGHVIGADNPHTGVEISTLGSDQGHIVGFGRMPNAGNTGGIDVGSIFSGVISSLNPLAGISNALSLVLPQPILDMFSGMEKLAEGLTWFLNPENWARIVSAVLGAILAIFGAIFLVRAAM